MGGCSGEGLRRGRMLVCFAERQDWSERGGVSRMNPRLPARDWEVPAFRRMC